MDDPNLWQISTPENVEELYDRSTLERFTLLKAQRVLEKTVGELADFVPFAWRNPINLSGQKRVGKLLRGIAASKPARQELVPAGKKTDE